MKIWHFSDTHGMHSQITVPTDIDIAIFSGDCSNSRDGFVNSNEVRRFIDWYKNIDIPVKIFVAGNHDTSIETGFITRKDFKNAGIEYLENELFEFEGFKIWGSPYSPSFGNWAFNKSRSKLHKIWDTIPQDTDILITHGPPKGILDVASDIHQSSKYFNCGCLNLLKQIKTRLNLSLHCFGHIHNNLQDKTINNVGLFCDNINDITFSNAACMPDMWDKHNPKIITNGNIIIL